MTRSRTLVLILGLVLAVAGCGSPPVAGGGGGGGGGGTADGGGNGKGGGTNSDGGSGGGTTDGGSGGGTTDGGSGGGTTDGGSGGVTDGGSGGATDGGSGGTTDGGSGGTTDGGSGGTTDGGSGGTTGPHIKTVFVIPMENEDWSSIKGSSQAPYINSLLSTAAHAENYHKGAVGTTHSEPNYLWLEAGTNFGIDNDHEPSANHQSTTQHLVTLLHDAGITWKAYQENIDGSTCPLSSSGLYAAKHNPMVFFDDVTGNLDKNDAYCIAHIRPFTELKNDLQSNQVAAYNFITPNLCDDMHGYTASCYLPSISDGDTWLSTTVPMIMQSQAYQDGGLILIVWDESEANFTDCSSADAKSGACPIGLIAISPFAKTGYASSVYLDHSSTLKSIEEIFGVSPLLGHAADTGVNDLSDLFTQFP